MEVGRLRRVYAASTAAAALGAPESDAMAMRERCLAASAGCGVYECRQQPEWLYSQKNTNSTRRAVLPDV